MTSSKLSEHGPAALNVISRVLPCLIFVFAAIAVFGFGSETIGLNTLWSVVTGCVLLTALFLLRHSTDLSVGDKGPAVRTLVLVTAFGLLLRLGFGILAHPRPETDMLAYQMAGTHLLHTGEYVCQEGPYLMRAYRPPGTAALLAGFMYVTGEHWWSALGLNSLLYAGTSVLLGIAAWRATAKGFVIILMLLAVWPSDVMVTGLPQSEDPSLLACAALIAVTARCKRAWVQTVALGLITGVSCLVRNSNLITVPLWLILLLRRPLSWPSRIAMGTVLIVCTLAPILPWTLRNQRVLGKPVLVATNGGENLYSANNPWTAGGWDQRSVQQLRAYLPDELAMDQAGYQLAKGWIQQHPRDFLRLGIQKMRILFGSDSWGPYLAIERASSYTGRWYQLAIQISTVWWLALWSLVVFGAARSFRAFEADTELLVITAFTLLPALLFFVFQSQPRYHAFMIPGLLWICGRTLYTRRADAVC